MKTVKVKYTGVSEATMAELLRLHKRNNSLTAETIVNAAKPVRNPLHHLFEWDDTVAGTQWRLEQARSLIRNVDVHIVDQPHIKTRAFVFVKNEAGEGYSLTTTVAESPVYLEQIRREFRRDLENWKVRLSEFTEFTDMLQGVDELLSAI